MNETRAAAQMNGFLEIERWIVDHRELYEEQNDEKEDAVDDDDDDDDDDDMEGEDGEEDPWGSGLVGLCDW